MVDESPNNIAKTSTGASSEHEEEDHRYDASHHEALRPHFAVPTPLGSPTFERRPTVRTRRGDSPDTFHDNEKTTLPWKERLRHFTWVWTLEQIFSKTS